MKNITIITGGRADYGLLRPVLARASQSSKLQLRLYVTGAHFSSQHGNTIDEIECDKQNVDEKIPLPIGDKISDVSRSMSVAITKISDLFEKNKPDLLVVLGDRYEIFAAAQAAFINNIPIAHIHGGELTFGAIDDGFRHCITKLSSLHFATTDSYKNRIIQMGENPKYVFNVGALGVENAIKLRTKSKKELERCLKFKFRKNNILITHHPVTAATGHEDEIDFILGALASFKNIGLIFTSPNADHGALKILKKIENFVQHNVNATHVSNLGSRTYHSLLKYVDGVVGNSSSGVLEVPYYGKWTLNIGPRQDGRVRESSVVDAIADEKLSNTISQLLDGTHPSIGQPFKHLYGEGSTSKKIINVLETVNFDDIAQKRFVDVKFKEIK